MAQDALSIPLPHVTGKNTKHADKSYSMTDALGKVQNVQTNPIV